jgi:hypothetical protein
MSVGMKICPIYSTDIYPEYIGQYFIPTDILIVLEYHNIFFHRRHELFMTPAVRRRELAP